MKTMAKEQIVESLNTIENLPLEARKAEFSRLFRATCELAQSTPAEIAHLTRINPEFVMGLYEGNLEGLPSEVFVRGFLKSISRQLKMPQDVFVNAYSRTLRNHGSDLSRKGHDEVEVKKPLSGRKSAEKQELSKTAQKNIDKNEGMENKSSEWTFGDQEVMKPHFMEAAHVSARPALEQSIKEPNPERASARTELQDLPHSQNPMSTASRAGGFQVADAYDQIPGFRAAADSKPAETRSQGSEAALAPKSKELDQKSNFETPRKENLKIEKVIKEPTFKEQTNKELSAPAPKFAFSKLWVIMGGVAVVLAAALWPRERAPNGTVIEEPMVSPKAEEVDGQSDPQVLEASTLPEPAAVPERTAEALPSSAVPIVPVSSVVKGTLAIPDGKQIIEITAKEDVKIRAFIDGQALEVDKLSPATHSYSFETNAEFFIYDAAAVDVTFNGRDLGSLGSKGKLRRLSFTKRLKDNKISN
ncbi:MAG: helix-turn-helix domain-containing protein [Pseudomonadota bacterium]